MSKTKLICNCNKTMPLDAKALAAALKLESTPNIASEPCRRHVTAFKAAVKNGGDLVVACTQEAPLFSELHDLQGENLCAQPVRDHRLHTMNCHYWIFAHRKSLNSHNPHF